MNALDTDLAYASCCRFVSLLFLPPSPAVLEQLRALAAELRPPLGDHARALLNLAVPELGEEYHRLLGGSGICPDCESDYEANALGAKGQLLADIAGFYEAFRFNPAAEWKAAPDHIAAEAGFLGYIVLKQALAGHTDRAEAAAVCEQAAHAFRSDHFDRWFPAFCDRLEACAQIGFYVEAARFARRAMVRQRSEQREPATPSSKTDRST